ncbi:MAG: coiled-coil domain-containing protein [Promethearchaeota archaeon]
MKDLTSNLDDKVVKALQHKIDMYEAEIGELKDILTKKDEEIASIANSKDDLNSKLEEAKDKLSELEGKTTELDKLNLDIYDLKKTVSIKDDQLDKLQKELDEIKSNLTDFDDLKAKGAELDDLKPKLAELTKSKEEFKNLLEEKEAKINELTENLNEKEKAYNEQKNKLEKVETELSELKPAEPTVYTSEERLVCLNCGAKGKDLKVEEDKSKVLGYIGHTPLYAKINVCKKCGYKF